MQRARPGGLPAPGGGNTCHMQIARIIAAIVLPPLGVFLTVGVKLHFWINVLLTILGFVPGIVHAVYVIAERGR